jgi:eukaryotic-like serine/threonine-protein kinase
MPEANECPECGRSLPPDAPRRLCPRCLLHHGLMIDDVESFDDLTHATSAGSSGIANDLAGARNGFPQVSLRDTQTSNDLPISRLTASVPPDSPGASGRYQLFGEIARGGMGAIFKGRDPELGRDLAVKVLLEQHRDDPQLVRRFIEEARIGGQLQHPGIVPVHELGAFADQRPYFTMKLVMGRTLAALLAARGNPEEDRARFLGIFEQVCQTMSYAHARGVIHRDLKPGNVMVGSFGEVQVMDWGLAKVLRADASPDGPDPERPTHNGVESGRDGSAADASRVGSVLGTPAYMAPEQARGETVWLDERVDVFGLGAILCEILTGQPPYVEWTAGEICQLAAGADLSGAWRRLDASGADSELVAMTRRCLSPLPRDRPRDASEVVSHLSVYLSGVEKRLKQAELASVEALAKAFQERTRRRLVVGLATAIVLLIATLAGAGSLAAWNRQRRSAEFDRALRDVELRRFEAETAGDDPAKWATAREAARRVEQILDDARDGAARVQVAALVADVKQKAGARATDVKLLDQLAEIRDTMDEVQYEQTDGAYAAAFRAARLLVDGESPEETASVIARRPPRVAIAVAAALDRWAALRRGHDDHEGAARLTAISQMADADAWRGRLRLGSTEPNRETRLTTLHELARSAARANLPPITLALLGEELLRAGDATAAEAILRGAQRQYPGDLGLSLALAQALEKLSRRPEAIRYYMMARALRPESGHALAHSLERVQETDEAIAVFRDLIRLSPGAARHYSCLGKMLRSRNLTREANEVLESGIDAGRETIRLWPDNPFAHQVLGTALAQRGRLDDAVAEYQEAIRLKPEFAAAHRELGVAHHRQGRSGDAVIELNEAIRLGPRDHQSRSALGDALASLGRMDEALSEFQETVRLAPDEPEAHFNLGLALFRHRRLNDALAEYREAIRLNLETAEVHYNIAHILQIQGHVDQAVAEYREAIRLKPDFAEAHCNLAHQLKAQGRYAESVAEFERGHELGSKRSGWTYPSAKWIEQARRVDRVERAFPAFLRGDVKPASVTERLDFAHVAYTRGLHATSARLWAEIFAVEPRLASEPTNRLRFAAARCAALAGFERGKDQPSLDDAARAALRRQARDWLDADLAAASTIVATKRPKAMRAVHEMLQYWESNLAAIREDESMAKLPEIERTEWRALWERVECLLNKSQQFSIPTR